MERCVACGKPPIVLVNIDMRGIVGLTHGWVHASRWVRHVAIPSHDARQRNAL